MMKLFCRLFLSLFVITLMPLQAIIGQSLQVGDPFELYLRALNPNDAPSHQIRPYLTLDSVNMVDKQITTHPWQEHNWFLSAETNKQKIFSLYTPNVKTTWNSNIPFGQNDGSLWQGRGLNSYISLGTYAEYGPLQISFRPELTYSQNRDFELSPFSPNQTLSDYAPPFNRRYDAPQRFGPDPVSNFHLGESYITLNWKSVSAGISNQNIWTGPALNYPVVFSNNAPGFVHGFIGTGKPADTRIGQFEGKVLWGGLYESDWFDEDPSNNMRYINAIMFNYSPSFLEGLHLGAARTYLLIYPEGGLQLSDYFLVAIPFTKDNFMTDDNLSGNDEGYQMLSLFGRWAFANSGFEVYGEWTRNDHARDNRDLSVHFTHARAYMLGFLKRADLTPNHFILLNAELNKLSPERGGLGDYRRAGAYYTNNTVIHGFTNRGQIMGSAHGPGSNSYLAKLLWYNPHGYAGLSFQHVVYGTDILNRNLSIINRFQEESYSEHELRETELRFGLHGLLFAPSSFEIELNSYYSRFSNRYFIHGSRESNFNIELTIRYSLPGFHR